MNEEIEKIRQDIISGNVSDLEYGIITIKEDTVGITHEVGNQHEFELSQKYGAPFNIGKDYMRDYGGYVEYKKSSFSKADEDTPSELKEQIRNRQNRMEQMQKRVKEYPAQYMLKGQVEVNGMVIPMTKKELIESGLDPEMFGWKSLEEVKRAEKKEQATVTAKSIASATKGLPKRAIESVRSLFSREKDERKDERGE